MIKSKKKCLFASSLATGLRTAATLVFVTVCALAFGACADRTQVLGPRPGMDAGADTAPTDRLREACGTDRNRVLYACTVPQSTLYLGDRQVRLAQVSVYSCGVRVIPRMMQLVLGRELFPGAGGFRGLVRGSAGTDYFANMAVIDGMRGGVVPHRVAREYNDSRTFRIEPMSLDIQDGEARHFFVVADIAEREDRPGELVGPEFQIGLTPWWGGALSPEALEITDYATGSRIPPTWLREAPWSNGCLDPRDHITIARPLGPRDAGR